MARINLTIDSHQYHDIWASSSFPNHSIQWKAAPGRETKSKAGSEHWQWMALRFLSTPTTRKTAVESASRDMVMGAVRASCEFSLLFSQQNHSVLSLTALYDAQKRLDRAKGAFQELKMSKSAKSKLDELLAWESHQLCRQMIRKISAAMEVHMYGAEDVTATKRSHFQVQLNRDQQAATGWSDGDWWSAKSYWSTKPIKWHLSNASFLINYSNIMSDNYCKKLGLGQLVPEAHSPHNLSNWRQLNNTRFMELQTWLPTSVWNVRSGCPMLRMKPPPGVSQIPTSLRICWRERFMASLWMSRCSWRNNCTYAWSSLKFGGRQLGFRSSGKPSNSV